MAKPIALVQQAGQNHYQHHLQILFDLSLREGGEGSEGTRRVCVYVCGGWGGGGGVESELEVGNGRKQQMVQLRTNRCGTCD